MCGISGFIGKKKYFPNKKKIHECINLMKRRGPDNQSFKKIEKKISYLLCSSRLSIIDLNDRSNQPFEDDNGILVFNGEIYNYLEIKNELKKKGVKFKTNSDTEVLLKFLDYEGEENLSKLDGMWAFAYFSKRRNKLIISRDKFGEKPLFYYHNKKKKILFFGSNVNYIKKLSGEKIQVNENKILNFLKNNFRGVFFENTTFHKDIFFLNQGSNLIIDKNFSIKIKNYWNRSKYNPTIGNIKTASLKLNSVIKKEFLKSFRSDTKIAFLLSGGVDSSIIISSSKMIKNKKKFYSIKSKSKKYDESKNINILVNKYKIPHEYITINKRKNFKLLSDLINEIGFPLMSSTYLAYANLCKKIKKDKFKVLISGNGGDEIFSGYYAHHMSYLTSIEKDKDFKKKYNEWLINTKPYIRNLMLKNFDEYKRITKGKFPTQYEKDEYKKFFKKKIKIKQSDNTIYSRDKFINNLDKDLFEDSIPAQLHSIDNISMFYSIESRAPFLSKTLYDLRNKFKKDLFIRNGIAKFTLREAFKNKIPKKILFNREKTGFYLPLGETLDLEDKKILKLILNNQITKKFLKKDLIKKKILNKELNHQEEKFIFSLLNVSIFLKHNKA